jgi:aryl-alcohol dehydrogenase-like predicted oxidoreductase
MLKKIKLGNSSLKVSEMALGCLGFGSKNDKSTSYSLLDYYFEQNGNFFDTANNYSFWMDGCKGGESETLLGKWIKERNNRSQIVLATKVGGFPLDRENLRKYSGSKAGWLDYAEGLSKKTIISAVEKSLKRLQTDYIDLYFAHIDDQKTPLEETLEALTQLVKQGKVREIACCNYETTQLKKAMEVSSQNNFSKYCAVQLFYTYLQSKEDSEFGIQVEAAKEHLDYLKSNRDVTLLAFTPLLWGLYAKELSELQNFDNFNNEKNLKRLKVIKDMANDLDILPTQLVYAWILHHDPRIIPLVAASKITHLESNLNAANIKLTKDHLELLNNC